MNEAKTIEFVFSDGTTHDASMSETSGSLRKCFKNVWSVAPITFGNTSGDATYTIEVSNDDINWFEYNNQSTDVSVADAVDDNHLSWVYMRIVYDSKTETTGTVRFGLTTKQK